ncbi:transferase [Nemania abortiva]|nr:transferase [Nemania abortiva]
MTRSDTKVSITTTHVVHSQHPISIQDPFILGPFDQLGHFSTPISVVWIYESSSSIDLVPVKRLHKAISRLLDYYPHLTGRLYIDPDTETRSITRIGTGILLFEAFCDTPLRSFARKSPTSNREFSIFDFPGFGNALVAPWDMSLEGAQRDPVFTIQRTKFACSSVAIGMRLSHVVGGAGTFLGLYQDLAEIYRASDPLIEDPIELASPPCLTPFMVDQMLYMDAEEQNRALAELPSGYSVRDNNTDINADTRSEIKANTQTNSETNPIVGRSLRFSPSAIAALKGQAVDPGNKDARVSGFTALTAHLWQRIHLARLALAKNCSIENSPVFSNSTLGTSVNFVPHFGLPERTIGNTVVTPVISLDSTKLAEAPLWEIATIISGIVRHVSVDETHKLGRWVAAQPKKSHISLNFAVTPTSFISTGWHRFPLYSGAEFDVPPTFASPVFMESMLDGMVNFLPRARDGGLEAICSLKSSMWEYLDKDEGFIIEG